MVLNILLVDASAANGMTEMWPGTHHYGNNDMEKKLCIDDGPLEERRKIAPPIQPTIPKGSLIIRDQRLWHAGIPNPTDEPRVMLAMVLRRDYADN
jgi:ectoine hydroxylase-related dioxygenase (phytanoyl-CoA dioxygenase family)